MTQHVTQAAFSEAFALKLEKYWGPLGAEARRWWQDFTDVEFGDPDFDWSLEAAEELATEYAREYSE